LAVAGGASTLSGCLYPQAMLVTAMMNHRQREARSPYRYRMSSSGDTIYTTCSLQSRSMSLRGPGQQLRCFQSL